MFKIITFFMCIFAISACTTQQENNLTAVEFVEKTEVGKNLSTLSYKTALKTHTFGMIAAQIGEEQASSNFKKELAITIRKYQSEWNKNLADSYIEHFSLEELNSVYFEKGASKYAKKFLSDRVKVADTMQSKSKDLLTTVVSEALSNTYKDVQ